MKETDKKPDHRPNRTLLLGTGWLLFALGAVGIVVPILPTTIFWIGAVWCWSRSSPRLSERILSHPRFGRPVHIFIERGEMTRPGKLLAITGITLGYLLMQMLVQPAWPTGLVVGLVLSGVAIWLWLRPEPTATTLNSGSDK